VALAVAVAGASTSPFLSIGTARAGAGCRDVIGGDLGATRLGPSDRSRSSPGGRQGLGTATAQTVTFTSLAVSATQPDRKRMAAIKAVSGRYPLARAIKAAAQQQGQGVGDGGTGAGGTEPTLGLGRPALLIHGLAAGQRIRWASPQFRWRRDRLRADRGVQFNVVCAAGMIRLDDLAATVV